MAPRKPTTAVPIKIETIKLPKLPLRYMSVTISSDAPLWSERMSEKAKRALEERDPEKKKVASRAPADPVKEFKDSLHIWTPTDDKFALQTRGYLENVGQREIEEEQIRQRLYAVATSEWECFAANNKDLARFTYCMPSMCIKNALVAVVDRDRFPGFTKVQFRTSVFVLGFMIKLVGVPHMHRGVVRLNTIGNPPQIRYRGEFFPWQAEITIKYDAGAVTADQIVSFLEYAGLKNGLGGNRPEKTGATYGQFSVTGAKEIAMKKVAVAG